MCKERRRTGQLVWGLIALMTMFVLFSCGEADRYEDKKLGVSFALPEGWKRSMAGEILVTVFSSVKTSESVLFFCSEWESAILFSPATIDVIKDFDHFLYLESAFAKRGTPLAGPQEVAIRGRRAVETLSKISSDKVDLSYKFFDEKRKTIFSFSLGCKPGDLDKLKPDLLRVVNSFEIK